MISSIMAEIRAFWMLSDTRVELRQIRGRAWALAGIWTAATFGLYMAMTFLHPPSGSSDVQPHAASPYALSFSLLWLLGLLWVRYGAYRVGLRVRECIRTEDLLSTQTAFSTRLVAAKSLDETAQLALEVAVDISHFDMAVIFIRDDSDGLRMMGGSGLPPSVADKLAYLPGESTLAQSINQAPEAAAVLRPDAFPEGLNEALSPETLQVAGRFIIRHEGRVIAALCIGSREDVALPEDVCVALEAIAAQISSAIARFQEEENRRLTENKYRSLFENSHDAMFTFAPPSWEINSANSAALRMFGVESLEQMASLPPWRRSPDLQPDGRRSEDAAVIAVEQAMRDGSSYISWRYKRLDGTEFPASVLLTRIETEGGVQIQATLRDLSRQQQTEEELNRSRLMLRKVLDSMPVGITVIGQDKRIRYANHSALEMMEYESAEEVLGKPCHETLCPAGEDCCPILDFNTDIDRSERVLTTRNGEKCPILKTVVPFEFDGESALLEVFVDISEQKRLEAETNARLERVRRHRNTLHELMRDEQIIDGTLEQAIRRITVLSSEGLSVEKASIWMIDPQTSEAECKCRLDRNTMKFSSGRRIAMGRRFPEFMAAMQANRVIDASNAKNDPRTAKFYQEAPRELDATSVLAAGIFIAGDLVGAVSFSHVDGQRNWTTSECNFASQIADQVAQAIVNDQRRKSQQKLKANLEDLRRANQMLEQLRSDAEKATRAKSEFLANMSHEIRTPMTAILGYSEMLIEEAGIEKAPPHRANMLRTIQRNGECLLDLINDILDISKIEAGKLNIETCRSNLQQLVEEVVGLMRVRADMKQLSLSVSYPGPFPETIDTDPMRLRQILTNLLGNAIKFTEEGEVQLVVEYNADADAPDSLYFHIVDTGIGMTHEQVEGLFQPFVQADTSTCRRYGGSGLGLAISRRLAELLGGTISVESEYGKGSKFSLSIAVGSTHEVALIGQTADWTAPSARTKAPAALPSFDTSLRILLAEDGPDNQRLISLVLQKAGAEVEIAENGKEAVDMAIAAQAAAEPFDVILMDMQMPVIDGYQATTHLRQEGCRLPIIALTANAMAGDEAKCLQAGCDGYTTKPIDRKLLLGTIIRHVQAHRSSGTPTGDSR